MDLPAWPKRFRTVVDRFCLGHSGHQLIYAWFLRNIVMKKDKGDEDMQRVWNAIRIGADSYLGRQLKTILPMIGLLTVVLFLSAYIVPLYPETIEEFPENTNLIIAVGRTVAFIMGAAFS